MLKHSNEYFLAFSRDLVIEAGGKALKHFRRVSGWLKENLSLVTEADLEIQDMLERSIKHKFPDHSFLGEEESGKERPKGDEEWLWVADPIDGTDAFASGLPVWGISLAVFHKAEAAAGVFYMPIMGELYHAGYGGESTLTILHIHEEEEHRNLHVDPDPHFHNRSLLLVTSDFHRRWTSDFPGKQRVLGSVAAHICTVARGAAVGSVISGSVWDIAAAKLILDGAGGLILNWETGEELRLGDYLDSSRLPPAIAVSSRDVYEQLKTMLKQR